VNLLKSKLRRTTAVVAGAILGLGGVAFLASPASAHHSEVSGTSECITATGEWKVTWSVDTVVPPGVNSWGLQEVSATPSALEAGSKIAPTGDQTPFSVKEAITSIQMVPGDATKANLTVKAFWNNGYKETEAKTGEVKLGGTCVPNAPKPDAHLASDCDGVNVTLANGKDATKDAEFLVKGENGYTKTVVVKAGQEDKTVKVPSKDAGKVTVLVGDKVVAEGKWDQPEECKPDVVERNYEVTCDEITFSIDNTKGRKTVEATFTPNKGEAKTLTVKAGEKGSVSFKGEKGLEIVPSEQGESGDAIKFDEEKPKECDATASPSPTEAAPAPGEGGGLPVTGPVASSIAGGAALLLIAGGVLFFMARRRKVKFTA
jgi:hypothetical protein